MKTYKASQELVDILLKFGFKDETEQHYPEHYSNMKIKGYIPGEVKRKFSVKSYDDYVLFDYINIELPNGERRDVMTEDEVKSMIIFHNLSSSDRGAWKKSRYGIFDAAKRLEDMRAYPQIYSTALNKRIKAFYNDLKNL